MAHSTEQRTNARAPSRVFTRYATLFQETKEHRVRRRFAALCITRVIQASTNYKIISNKWHRSPSSILPLAYAMMGRVSAVHFGLAALHELVDVTAGKKPRNDALSLSCSRRPQLDMERGQVPS